MLAFSIVISFALLPTHRTFTTAENLATPAAAMAASAPIPLLSPSLSSPLPLLSPSRSPWPPQDLSPRPVPPVHASPTHHHHLHAAFCILSLPPLPSFDLPFQPAEVKIFWIG
ncbi:hypothetical protein BDA96_05G103100 [Sorghum bicolor]|uniref:Uncharacterized protein n=1 Tax=Sorghum bicolor TaxID=4558 RepID=A0A921QYK9_SORBI|nr:hypothetical protein BDA96_05G103100 [Sorghum bicolor]